MFIPGGLASIFGPGSKFVMPQSTFNPQPAPTTPSDGRSYYTGTLGTDDAYSEAGSRNSAPASAGPQLGPSGYQVGQGSYGVVPIGGYSQLGGRLNGAYSGYYSPDPTAPVPGTQLPEVGPYASPYQNPAPHVPNGPAAPSTPKPAEVPSWMQPMQGQWGGGAWNVGSGAPASMQQMWLGSMNGGKTWGQAPSYNATAPQPGQASRGGWMQTASQDPDSPTWVQGGR